MAELQETEQVPETTEETVEQTETSEAVEEPAVEEAAEGGDDTNTEALGRQFFIGNVPFQTTQDEITEYFEQFGTVHDCKLMRDNMSGKPDAHRGFGFLQFKSKESTEKFLAQTHTIRGRDLNISRARPKTVKFFLAPIDKSITNKESLTKFFEQFGEVSDVFHNVERGFAFVTVIDTGDNLTTLLNSQNQTIDGKELECKIAKPRQGGGGRGRGGPGMGRGRDFGGYGYGPWAAWGQWGNGWGMGRSYSPFDFGGGWGGRGRGGRRRGRSNRW